MLEETMFMNRAVVCAQVFGFAGAVSVTSKLMTYSLYSGYARCFSYTTTSEIRFLRSYIHIVAFSDVSGVDDVAWFPPLFFLVVGGMFNLWWSNQDTINDDECLISGGPTKTKTR